MTRLLSVGSHHRNLSIIFIIHNLFHYGKEMRTLSLNSHYIMLFKNPRDKLQISTLARQMYPGNSQFLIEAFQYATKQAHGYLLIDWKPSTEDKLRVRTGLLPSDKIVVYVQKDSNTWFISFVVMASHVEHVKQLLEKIKFSSQIERKAIKSAHQ